MFASGVELGEENGPEVCFHLLGDSAEPDSLHSEESVFPVHDCAVVETVRPNQTTKSGGCEDAGLAQPDRDRAPGRGHPGGAMRHPTRGPFSLFSPSAERWRLAQRSNHRPR